MKESQWTSKILQLRHLGVHLSINFQNASLAPVEIVGNSDVLVCFQCGDERDRGAFAKCANMTAEQGRHLSFLERGECVCFLGRSRWKVPFLGLVPTMDFVDVKDEEIARKSQEFLKGFSWLPVNEEGQAIEIPRDGGSSRLDANAEAFLRDVLNQAFEFSALTQRFERAGIRSASMQGRVLRRLLGDGYVKVHELAIGKGRPIKLVEGTKKAFEEYEIEWKKTRGSLVVRAGTDYLFRKIRRLSGWACVREGEVEGKQIDLLCRNEEGELVSIEIAGSEKHEVHNALHCLRNGAKRHYVVCVSREVVEKVKKKFSEFLELGSEKVQVLTLSDVLKDEWSL